MYTLSFADKKKVRKPLLWVGMASMFMAFAGLISGYIVSRKALLQEGLWVVFDLPQAFYYSTGLLFISSLLLVLASRKIKTTSSRSAAPFLFLALLCGLGFLYFQLLGWSELKLAGVFFTGEGSFTSGSWVYAITFFHLLHLSAGLIVLIITSLRAYLNKYSVENRLGFDIASQFWHFLGTVWLCLFLFLLFIR